MIISNISTGDRNSNNPLFSVFTGTFNRGLLLRRVYESLLAQTLTDFEWLVVDDGSTDDTRKQVESMIMERRLNIRYFYKDNGGVHTAHNLAISVAAGYFFARCDSDDELLPDALQIVWDAWQAISHEKHYDYSGILCLDEDEEGKIIGERFPKGQTDFSWKILSEIPGDKMRVYRTEVLRDFPFPIFANERLVPESLVWGRIHDQYKMHCVNILGMRVHHGSADRLSHRIKRFRYESSRGYALYYCEELSRKHSMRRYIALSINYVRVMRGRNVSASIIIATSPRKILTTLMLPCGLFFYYMDCLRGFAQWR